MVRESFIITIPMPFTGESIVDGIILSWLVKTGDHVKKSQPLAEIETEKSAWEFESPCDGEVVSLKARAGDIVAVGTPLVEIMTTDPDMRHLELDKLVAERIEVTRQSKNDDSSRRGENGGRSELKLSPRVKKLLLDNNVNLNDISKIKGNGQEGRITVEDVERYVESLKQRQSTAKKAASGCYITGVGAYVPEHVIDNSFFADKLPDINADYIEKVTGIKERRYIDNAQSTSDLGLEAAKTALEAAGLDVSAVQMIIVATSTPDMPLPATACALQQKLGCPNIPAFDIAAACSGWLFGLSLAQQYIENGTFDNILVIAAETMSRFTDKTDRSTAFLFGDGAGAALVSSSPAGHRLSGMIIRGDSTGYDIIYRKAGGSSLPPGSKLSPGDEYWYMDGGRMFRGAVAAFSEIINAVSEKAGIELKDFRWIVPHQANQRILKAVANKVKIEEEKFFSNIALYGNTSAASVPLAIRDLEMEGRIKTGDKILLCAVGAGLTYAGCVLEW
ncbi:MAG: beta-ketoacyl-ACP synthase 3 [Spirochaetota bacterium]